MSDPERTISVRYEALDGLRGVCALMVVLYHGSFNSHIRDWVLVERGWLFVDFFFVLSGFIIADVYGSKIRTGVDYLRFVALRLGRLYPLHLFILALYVAYEICWWLFLGQYSDQPREAFSDKNSVEGLVLSLTMFNAMGVLDYLVWNIPSWSIGAEFYTYLVFGLIILLTRAKPIPILIGLAIVSVLLCATAGPYKEQTYNGFFRCLAGFSIGALLRLSGFRMPRSSQLAHSIAEGAALLLAMTFVLATPADWQFIAPFVFVVVVWAFVPQAGLLSQILCTRPGQALGAWSYSIYMVHFFVLQLTFNFVSVLGAAFNKPLKVLVRIGSETRELVGIDRWQGDLGLALFVGSVLCCAMLTYRFIEVPARDWSRFMVQKASRPRLT